MMTKIGTWYDPSWVEQYQWFSLGNHLHVCIETGLYHYNDETSTLDIWGYSTRELAAEAMQEYVESL